MVPARFAPAWLGLALFLVLLCPFSVFGFSEFPLTGLPASTCAPGLPAALPWSVPAKMPCSPPVLPLQVKLAYGKTFGTCTELNYTTLELSRPVTRYPILTVCGPAVGQVQVAMLASYVSYHEGDLERFKRLNFRDGYELAWLPKGRFVFWQGLRKITPYAESGAGLSYVSETFRNSGSRWNWSFLGGLGVEWAVRPQGTLALGVQWRHLCNGNMWGTGDELHNSNSGTDMIQASATIEQRF